MRLEHAKWQCLRCGSKGKGQNAQGVAAQHEKRTGHSVEVNLTYRSGNVPKSKPSGPMLPLVQSGEEKR